MKIWYWVLAIAMFILPNAFLVTNYYSVWNEQRNIRLQDPPLIPAQDITERSAIKVEDLLAKSPKLEQTLAETHDVVLHLQDSMKLLEHVPERIDDIQIDEQKIRIQLDNVQKQVHSIPGVPK